MRRTAFAFCAAVVAVFVRPACAQTPSRPVTETAARVPNLVGTTGLLLAPSAYVPRTGQIVGALGGAANRGGFAGGSLTLGLGGRAELGVAALDPDGAKIRLRANAKMNLLPETLLLPAVSVGVVDAFDAANTGAGSAYVVASKYVVRYFVQGLTGVPLAVKVHAGWGGGAFGDAPFAGVELFPGDSRVSALAEVVRGDVNVGARLYAGNFSATVGWLDFRRAAGSVSYAVALR